MLKGVTRLGQAFMAPGGEMLWRDGKGYDDEKVLRGKDLIIRPGVKMPDGKCVDQVWWYWRSSKADQEGEGAVGVQCRVPGHSLCPYEAASEIFTAFPERQKGGEEDGLPLFRLSDGSPVKRSLIRDLLGRGATRAGYPRSRVGVHSLRVGGATALWLASEGNAPLVRRLGRWASDAYHRYLWDLPQMPPELTAKMLTADTEIPWARIVGEVTGVPAVGGVEENDKEEKPEYEKEERRAEEARETRAGDAVGDGLVPDEGPSKTCPTCEEPLECWERQCPECRMLGIDADHFKKERIEAREAQQEWEKRQPKTIQGAFWGAQVKNGAQWERSVQWCMDWIREGMPVGEGKPTSELDGKFGYGSSLAAGMGGKVDAEDMQILFLAKRWRRGGEQEEQYAPHKFSARWAGGKRRETSGQPHNREWVRRSVDWYRQRKESLQQLWEEAVQQKMRVFRTWQQEGDTVAKYLVKRRAEEERELEEELFEIGNEVEEWKLRAREALVVDELGDLVWLEALANAWVRSQAEWVVGDAGGRAGGAGRGTYGEETSDEEDVDEDDLPPLEEPPPEGWGYVGALTVGDEPRTEERHRVIHDLRGEQANVYPNVDVEALGDTLRLVTQMMQNGGHQYLGPGAQGLDLSWVRWRGRWSSDAIQRYVTADQGNDGGPETEDSSGEEETVEGNPPPNDEPPRPTGWVAGDATRLEISAVDLRNLRGRSEYWRTLVDDRAAAVRHLGITFAPGTANQELDQALEHSGGYTSEEDDYTGEFRTVRERGVFPHNPPETYGACSQTGRVRAEGSPECGKVIGGRFGGSKPCAREGCTAATCFPHSFFWLSSSRRRCWESRAREVGGGEVGPVQTVWGLDWQAGEGTLTLADASSRQGSPRDGISEEVAQGRGALAQWWKAVDENQNAGTEEAAEQKDRVEARGSGEPAGPVGGDRAHGGQSADPHPENLSSRKKF